jgi:hypothetical protein
LGLENAEQAVVRQNGCNGSQTTESVILPLIMDETVPMNCAWIPSGLEGVRRLGAAFGPIDVKPV